MPKIPFSTRRSGRYYFRRRVRLHDGKDIHVIVPLSTCDGQEARERAAILAAQFDRVRRTVNAYFEQNQTLDASTIKALFETELRDCLSKLIMELHDPSRDPAARVRDWGRFANGGCWPKLRSSCQAGFGKRHRSRSWLLVRGILKVSFSAGCVASSLVLKPVEKITRLAPRGLIPESLRDVSSNAPCLPSHARVRAAGHDQLPCRRANEGHGAWQGVRVQRDDRRCGRLGPIAGGRKGDDPASGANGATVLLHHPRWIISEFYC